MNDSSAQNRIEHNSKNINKKDFNQIFDGDQLKYEKENLKMARTADRNNFKIGKLKARNTYGNPNGTMDIKDKKLGLLNKKFDEITPEFRTVMSIYSQTNSKQKKS